MKANLDTSPVQQLSKWTTVGERPANMVLSPVTGQYETIEYEEVETTADSYTEDSAADGSIWTDLWELIVFLSRIILQGIGWIVVGGLFLLAFLLHGFGQGIQSGLGRRSRTKQFRRYGPSSPRNYPQRRTQNEEIIIQQQIKIRR